MDPFLLVDSDDYGDVVTDAVVHLLATRGLAELTVRGVAGQLGVTPQAVNYRLGDPNGPRYRVIQLATVTFGARWINWIEDALLEDVPLPALPGTEGEVRGVRVWQALRELARVEAARGNDHVAGAIDRVRAQERGTTHRQLERWAAVRLPEPEIAGVCCLVDGLRLDLASWSPSLSLADARAMLRAEFDGLRARASGAA